MQLLTLFLHLVLPASETITNGINDVFGMNERVNGHSGLLGVNGSTDGSTEYAMDMPGSPVNGPPNGIKAQA